jgi:hypothetical protein
MDHHGPQVELYQLQDIFLQEQEHKMRGLLLVDGRLLVIYHVPKNMMGHHGPQVEL